MSEIEFTTVSSEAEVFQILELQTANHLSTVSVEIAENQGFVTVRHESETLLAMNRSYPSVIAKDGEKLAGYCLMMSQGFGGKIPELVPMFEMFSHLSWRGKPFAEWRWFVMGQVCVAEGYRGAGVFDGMYFKLREAYRERFDFTVTEVAIRNRRSMRAHERVGFQTIHEYVDPVSGEHWAVVLWEF